MERKRHSWQVGRDVSMNEQELRQLIAAVKAGRVSRRTFARRMVGLGLTAPLASQLLAHAGLAQSPAAVDYKPTGRGRLHSRANLRSAARSALVVDRSL